MVEYAAGGRVARVQFSAPRQTMSTIYDSENNEEIIISFPKEKFQVYLKKLKVSDKKKLTFSQIKKIFITSITDFKKGKLSLDETSAIALYLWDYLSGKEKATTDLGDVLYKCSELNYYVRCLNKKKSDTFVWFMSDVMDYYKKKKTTP